MTSVASAGALATRDGRPVSMSPRCTAGGSRRAEARAASSRSRAVTLPGPDQAGKPAGVVRAGHVQRVEVEPGAPADGRDPGRERHRPARIASQHGSVRVQARQPVPGVVVGVAVDEQVEPGAGAGLDQRQRLRQLGQGGQQDRAPGRLVGLGAPGHDQLGQFGPGLAGQLAQRPDGGRSPEQVAGRREQQVRLALGRRQRRDEAHQRRVAGDRLGQHLVSRRPAPRLQPAEFAVGPRHRRRRVIARLRHNRHATSLGPGCGRGTDARRECCDGFVFRQPGRGGAGRAPHRQPSVRARQRLGAGPAPRRATRTPTWSGTRGRSTPGGTSASPTAPPTRPRPGTRSSTGTSGASTGWASSPACTGRPSGGTRRSSWPPTTCCSDWTS